MPPRGTGSPYRNGTRFWGDFRSYADVGGDREPLIDKDAGEKLATKDSERARVLYDARREELKGIRSGASVEGNSMLPLEYVATHYLPYLEQKKRNKRRLRVGDPLKPNDIEAIKKARHALTICLTQPAAVKVTTLRGFGTGEVSALIRELHQVRKPNGEALSPQTVRRHLMELSGMFERARFDKLMDANPLDAHPDVPPPVTGSALDANGFFTRDEVRRFLEEVVPTTKSPWAVEQAYVLFYTGCRLEELNGILVRDVDFDDDMIHIVDYAHRSIKSKFSRRSIPLWPKLAEVLRDSLARTPRPLNGILFPSVGSVASDALEDQMMTRIRKTLQSAAVRAGIPEAKKTGHHIGRHSYTTARRDMVETTPLGKDVPVPNSVIVREVGHATDELIQTTYGHIPRTRVRQQILDYGDAPVDLDERWRRSKALMSESVRNGLEKAKARRKAEARAASPTAAGRPVRPPTGRPTGAEVDPPRGRGRETETATAPRGGAVKKSAATGNRAKKAPAKTIKRPGGRRSSSR